MSIDIRSITTSLEIKSSNSGNDLEKKVETLMNFFQDKNVFNLKPRTKRVSIIYKELINMASLERLLAQLKKLEQILIHNDIRWMNITFSTKQIENINQLPEIVRILIMKVSSLFIHVTIPADAPSNHYLLSGSTILRVANIYSSGYANYRLGFSNGSCENTPFFPFSTFKNENQFSIALEPCSLLLSKIDEAGDSKVFNKLSSVLNEFSQELSIELKILNDIFSNQNSLEFKGFDASLSPIPHSEISIGNIYRKFGIYQFGNPLTLSITSLLTESIKKAFIISKVKQAGFNGVMLSPLEDKSLANAVISGNVNLDSLLLFSTVCGCGLDMVPVPGNTMADTLACIIKDTNELSRRLSKPLGSRILAIPGKTSSDLTAFNHDFLNDTRVISTKEQLFQL